jgi:hypothetical protein
LFFNPSVIRVVSFLIVLTVFLFERINNALFLFAGATGVAGATVVAGATMVAGATAVAGVAGATGVTPPGAAGADKKQCLSVF